MNNKEKFYNKIEELVWAIKDIEAKKQYTETDKMLLGVLYEKLNTFIFGEF